MLAVVIIVWFKLLGSKQVPSCFAWVIKSRQYKQFVLENFLSDIEMVP